MTILIAGSGVAAVECALALRGHADVELLSPAAELHYRPASVTAPFGGAPAARIDLGGLGVRHHRDALAAVEVGRHRVLTRDGIARPYETLVVATGARSRDAVPGAITFRGAPSAGRVERALAAGGRRVVVFAAPPGPHWLLPLYELALPGGRPRRRDRWSPTSTSRSRPSGSRRAPRSATCSSGRASSS